MIMLKRLAVNWKQLTGLVIFIVVTAATTGNVAAGTWAEEIIGILRPVKTVKVTILQTSDLHNHAGGSGPSSDYTPYDVSDTDGVLGGYARLATLIDRIRKDQESADTPVLLLDSGDFFMGTAYDMADKDTISLKFFQLMGYDAVTLGNHEFDWMPSGLARLLDNGIDNGFSVPIVASNMITSDTDPIDDDIEELEGKGVIVSEAVIDLPNGLRVGILGLMGEDADQYSPGAAPIAFNHDFSYIQDCVDRLRVDNRVHLVIVLSHSGFNLSRYISSGSAGNNTEDIDLAEKVSGIDVILSGHAHVATDQQNVRDLMEANENGTFIVAPGEHGEWLARLDLTFDLTKKRIVDYGFELISVDDSVLGDGPMQEHVEQAEESVNERLIPLSLEIDSHITEVDFVMELASLEESGLGNLAADAVRYASSAHASMNDGNLCDVGLVGSGLIRGSLRPGRSGLQTFADIYRIVPLGISSDESQPFPGAPLVSFYLTAADLRNVLEISMTLAQLYSPEFYLNFSGLHLQYDPAQADVFHGVTAISLCDEDDIACLKDATPIDLNDDVTLYKMVANFNLILAFGEIQDLLGFLGLDVIPRDQFGEEISVDRLADRRIDTSAEEGIQELKEWMAMVSFLLDHFPVDKGGITEDIYGEEGAALGRIQFVN